MVLLFTTVACDKIEIPSNDQPQTEGSGGNNGGRQHKALDSEYAESGKQQTLQQHCKQKIYRIFKEYTQFFKIYPV